VAVEPRSGQRLRQVDLIVPGVHCGACIALLGEASCPGFPACRSCPGQSVDPPGVGGVRGPQWPDAEAAGRARRQVQGAWLSRRICPAGIDEKGDPAFRELLKALAVAGFASMNVMLLSVSVWSGAEAATRDLFHWISALIAAPALAYSGRIFFRLAWGALKHGRANMDVPISLGVILAYAISLHETITHGEHAYFDASVTLLFFLLAGARLIT
jgi:Cu2+-exporting ATPase